MSLKKLWVLVMILVLWGCTGKPEDQPGDTKTTILSLGETMPSHHPSAAAMELFAQLVKERTEGRVEIHIYFDGSQGTPKELIEQVKFGGIAMARVNALELSEAIEGIGRYFTPGEYSDGDELIAQVKANQEQLIDLCQFERVTPLVWFFPDFRCFYGIDNQVSSYQELAGMKINSADARLITETLEGIGADTVGLINTDISKALIAGNIQSVESSFSELICQNYGTYIKYVTINNGWYFSDVLLINTERLTSLDKADREIIEACAAEVYDYQKEMLLDFQEDWLKELEMNAQIDFIEGVFQ